MRKQSGGRNFPTKSYTISQVFGQDHEISQRYHFVLSFDEENLLDFKYTFITFQIGVFASTSSSCDEMSLSFLCITVFDILSNLSYYD